MPCNRNALVYQFTDCCRYIYIYSRRPLWSWSPNFGEVAASGVVCVVPRAPIENYLVYDRQLEMMLARKLIHTGALGSFWSPSSCQNGHHTRLVVTIFIVFLSVWSPTCFNFAVRSLDGKQCQSVPSCLTRVPSQHLSGRSRQVPDDT